MATVRMSDKLIGEVRSLIGQLRVNEIRAEAGDAVTDLNAGNFSDAERLELVKLVWGEHYEKWSGMPEAYKAEASRVRLRVKIHDAPSYDVWVNNTSAMGAFLPPNFDSYNTRYSVDCTHPLVAAHHEARTRWREINERITAEYKATEDQIMKFLSAYTTLNTAVSAWKGIRAFVPKEYLETLDRKVVRTKAAKDNPAVEGIDFDALSVAAAAARMGG